MKRSKGLMALLRFSFRPDESIGYTICNLTMKEGSNLGSRVIKKAFVSQKI
ncbi:hypothetical protein MKY29_21425 [Psychrobacillus sp. FSL K6-2365]|uniref:hypothetical protein n=1 Tax=Psychrobacillus sp. FSL K6-2365 TaxID=2921546 RepID=UPI0030F5920E